MRSPDALRRAGCGERGLVFPRSTHERRRKGPVPIVSGWAHRRVCVSTGPSEELGLPVDQ
eukprot:5522713-Alexandrium_andersonii.AAC.1